MTLTEAPTEGSQHQVCSGDAMYCFFKLGGFIKWVIILIEENRIGKKTSLRCIFRKPVSVKLHTQHRRKRGVGRDTCVRLAVGCGKCRRPVLCDRPPTTPTEIQRPHSHVQVSGNSLSRWKYKCPRGSAGVEVNTPGVNHRPGENAHTPFLLSQFPPLQGNTKRNDFLQ